MNWKVSPERIQQIIDSVEEVVYEPFDNTTLVVWRLPNEYVISEQSSCVDPKDYDRELGLDICRERLEDKVWELEGYLRKQQFTVGGF